LPLGEPGDDRAAVCVGRLNQQVDAPDAEHGVSQPPGGVTGSRHIEPGATAKVTYPGGDVGALPPPALNVIAAEVSSSAVKGSGVETRTSSITSPATHTNTDTRATSTATRTALIVIVEC
jgi:hypothetical protein